MRGKPNAGGYNSEIAHAGHAGTTIPHLSPLALTMLLAGPTRNCEGKLVEGYNLTAHVDDRNLVTRGMQHRTGASNAHSNLGVLGGMKENLQNSKSVPTTPLRRITPPGTPAYTIT